MKGAEACRRWKFLTSWWSATGNPGTRAVYLAEIARDGLMLLAWKAL